MENQTTVISSPAKPTNSPANQIQDKLSQKINIILVKKYLTRIISIALIIKGVFYLSQTIIHIFRYTNQVSNGGIEYAQFQQILKSFIIKGVSALADTTFGLIMLLTHSQKLKMIHYLIAAFLLLLPLFLNDQVLNQIESSIPQVQNPISKVYAQTPPQQAQSDLNFQLQQYQDAHKQYLSAKNSFLSFNTLNSKTEAIAKTKTLLLKRTQTLKSYIFALRVNLINLPPQMQPKPLIDQLETQEQFLSQHLTQIETINTTEQISSVSQSLEDIYPEIQVLSYQSLLTLINTQLDVQQQQLTAQHQTLTELLDQDTNNELNETQINLWLDDAKTSLNFPAKNLEEIEKLQKKLRASKSSLIPNQRNFSKILNLLDKNRTSLLKSIGFLSETINLFKYGQI